MNSLDKFVNKIQAGYKGTRIGKDDYVKYLAIPLHKLGVHPNMLTAFGFLCALISIYFLFNNHTLFVVFYLLNFLSDMVDGTLARISKVNNPYGMYIDAIADALYGILILVKAYFHFKNPLILIPLFVYLLEAIRLENWAPGFYPNVTWLKISYMFKLFKFGIILQLCVSLFNISVRKMHKLKYVPPKS